MKQLYKYLDDFGDDYSDAFSQDYLVYLPGSVKKWYSSNEVIWDDSSQVLGNLYGWVSPDYESSELKLFFLNKINISENVKNEDLAKAWLRLQKITDLDSEDVEASLAKIYPQLLSVVKSLDGLPEWWSDFVDEVMVWTQSDEFIDADEVYVADDIYLRNLFIDDLNFVWKPSSLPHSILKPLYDELEIPSLSERVDVTLDDFGESSLIETPVFLTDLTKLLLCYLVYNDSPDKFEELINSGTLKELLQSVEARTDSLIIKYDVADSSSIKTVTDKNAFIDISRHILYFRNEIEREDILDDIAEVIARAIWGAIYKKHEDHVRVTLAITSDNRFKKIRDKKGWNLPPEVRKDVLKLIAKSGQTPVEETSETSKEPDPEKPTSEPKTDNIGSTSSSDTRGNNSGSGSTERTHGHGNHNPSRHGSTGRQRGQGGGYSSTGQRGSSSDTRGQGSGTGQSDGISAGSRASNNSSRAGKSRSQGLASSFNQARRNQMRSYVANELDDDLNNDSDDDIDARRKAQEARNELGKQGELEVVDDLRAKGYIVTRMPENNKGYDIEAVNPETSEILYIEVKGDSFNWNDKGVGISPSQYHFGLEKRSSFYLAVVENLRSSPRTIYYIQDPVSQITQYRFDSEWVGVSTTIKIVATGDQNKNQSLAEALSDQTESDKCKEIIKYCDEQRYPFPDIGTELVNDAGAVIFENIELAWENESIGVLLSEDERDEATGIDEHWSFYVADDYEQIITQLDSIFNIDTKCE